MSNRQNEFFEQPSLTVGDRINYPYILANAILKFHESIVRAEGEQSEQEVREAALCLYNSIPDDLVKADEQFKKEVAEAVVKEKVDARREWCGVKVGKPKYRVEVKIEPYRLYRACMNVFQRRGFLSRKIFTEKIVPEPEDFKELEEEFAKNAGSEDRS